MSYDTPLKIGIPIFHNFALIDVMGPLQLLGFMAPPHPQIQLIAKSTELVRGFPNVVVKPDATFADCGRLDVLVVPGCADPQAPLADDELVAFVKDQGSTARYVLSVCVGAYIAAKAGLLDGKLVTTYWGSLGSLARMFPSLLIAGGYPRYVVSGNVITTGGLSSGMDGAVALIAMLRGAEEAKAVTLAVQYAPKPPFASGDPEQAEPQTISLANSILSQLSP
jgi:cyclohexyl-isocyanide hydratase